MKINRYTLVEHSIIFAKKLNIFENIFISSDSSQILDIGHKRNIKLLRDLKDLVLITLLNGSHGSMLSIMQKNMVILIYL